MSARTLHRLILALAAAFPGTSSALDVSAELGVSYSRLELTPPGSPSTTEPRLDLDLGLDARGAIAGPEVVDWKLSSSYRRVSESVSGTQTRLQKLVLYDGSAALFRSPSSALTLQLGGSRNQNEFSTAFSVDTMGQAITDQARASVTVRPGGSFAPLSGAYSFRNLEENIPGQPTHVRETQGISARTASGNAAYNVAASYRGDLNDGTWNTDRFDLHDVTVTASAPLGGKLFANVDEHYYRLEPKTTGIGVIAQENTAFRAHAHDDGIFGDRHVLEYLYTHIITEIPATTLTPANLQESARNSVRYEGDHLLTSPTLFTRWLLDASFAQSRVDASETTSSGETAGVQLWWRQFGPDRLYEVHGGPQYGFIQERSRTDVAKRGYGGNLSGRLSQPFVGQVGQLGYEGAFGSELFGVPGWSLRQSLFGGLEGQLWTGRYTTFLRGSTVRTHSPLFGDGATRSVEAYATAAFRRVDFDLRLLGENGVSGATPSEFSGDGLFIPAPFDTSTRQLWVRGTVNLLPGLNARAQFRYVSSVRPGQPAIDQTEVIGGVDYHYAAFSFSLEDRVDWFENGGKSNTFLVRVYRRFDARF